MDTIIREANLSSTSFATSPVSRNLTQFVIVFNTPLQIYEAWETDSIISVELWRNLSLCLLAVGGVSLLLLGDLRLTLMVVTCILATIVDLIGTLHFWDVTIDVIVCVNIVLVGASIYNLKLLFRLVASALTTPSTSHILSPWLRVGGIGCSNSLAGTPTERAQSALVTLGPAIVNAGITTLLAVIILPFSGSHVFITFFKVFSLTVLYGVFHGLVFLPTILASFGSNNESSPPVTPTSPKTPHINPVFIK